MTAIPTAVWTEVQEAIYQHFTTRWTLLTTPPTIFFSNEEPNDPPDGQWGMLIVQRRVGGPGTIGKPGNRKMDRVGTVFVLLREPPGDGVSSMSDLGEYAAKIFEDCRLSVHGIRFATSEPGVAEKIDNGKWWGVAVEARFDFEELI
jgi:hypothetical protein